MAITIDTTTVTQLVDGVFAFVESNFPFFAGTLAWLDQQIDAEVPALVAFLASQGLTVISAATITAFLDGLFAFAEAKIPSPIVVALLKTVNVLIDEAGVLALVAFLKGLGIDLS